MQTFIMHFIVKEFLCLLMQGTDQFCSIFLSTFRKEEVDTLITVSPDPFNAMLGPKFNEKFSENEIRGKVWALSEEALPYNWSWSSIYIKNELALQHLLPPRKLLCVTNNGTIFVS